jgi:hypothetical protein
MKEEQTCHDFMFIKCEVPRLCRDKLLREMAKKGRHSS